MSKPLQSVLTLLLVTGAGSLTAANPPPVTVQPTAARLLNIHLFWLDDSGTSDGRTRDAALSSLGAAWDLRHYDYARSQLLRAEPPDGWRDGEGTALVLVPRLGDRWAQYTLTTALQDPGGRRRYRIDAVVGTRTRGRFGSVHTIDLARVAALPRFAREEVGELVEPQLMERSVYWEAAFELPGLRRDEIKRVDALGPALIKPPRKALQVLDSLLQPAEIPEQAEGHNCLGLGPIRLCLDLPDLASALQRTGSLQERNEVRLTRSLWHAGESCGVVVVGRLVDYSIVTFRVHTNGKGSHPAGTLDLMPFRLTGALGETPGLAEPTREAPGRTLLSFSPVAATGVAHRWALDGPGERPGSPRFDHRPGSLSLESILERAFSPERE